jgi:5-methylcytosine-specific restriction endonuclease McrA
MRQYTARRRDFLIERPVCEICKTGRSREVHHRSGRTGKRLLDETEWMALCWSCHTDVHSHGAKARANGFLK